MPRDGTRFDSWRSPNRGDTRRAHGRRARDARFADDTGSGCGPNRSSAGGPRANRARTVSPRLPTNRRFSGVGAGGWVDRRDELCVRDLLRDYLLLSPKPFKLLLQELILCFLRHLEVVESRVFGNVQRHLDVFETFIEAA